MKLRGFGLIPALFLCFPAAADQVTLTNGDKVTGSIIELSNQRLRIRSELLGELNIPLSAIRSLAAETPMHVMLTDRQAGVVGTVTAQKDMFEIRTEPEVVRASREELHSMRSPEAHAAYEKALHPGFFDFWELGANVGFSTRGRMGTTSTTLSGDLKRRTPRDEFKLHYQSLFESEANRTVVNDDKARASVIYKRDMTRRWYAFGGADFDYDALQNLNLRWVLVTGIGWHAVKRPRLRLDVAAGAALDEEIFDQEPKRRSGEALLGQEFSLNLTSISSLEERLFFYPNLSERGQFRVQLNMSYVIRLNSWLSWQLTYTNHYLSHPPPETDKNDLLVTSGLRFTFGKTNPEGPR
jgi:hypothetical protein